MIPQSFIQELLNRLDIVEVVERYVPLKKAGANYVACCPFHNEKSPSFSVSPSKQFYHCFGCGAHGSAVNFVMEHVGLGFVDAVEELAKSIGLEVPREERADAAQRPRVEPDLFDVMQTATRYYIEQLKQSPRAVEYLKTRGMSGEIAKRFGVGYAPDGWQSLAAVFPDYPSKSLTEVGLVIESDGGKKYDRFRDRIMFPIVGGRGQVIGFGGRVLDKGEPKYLNSPETPLFEKGRELYGLFQAQKSIRAEGMALVVEGYMDVVALAQHGIEYAVATLGTATTPYHIQKLLRMTDQVVFCFDGDAAGRRAAWRALENALPHLQDGKQLRFLFLSPEHDPDSYVREFGKEAFEHLLGDEALPLSGYLLRELGSRVDLATQEGRSALLEYAKPLLVAISAPSTALLLRKEVAALAGIALDELEALYGIKSLVRPRRPTPAKAHRAAPSGGLNALLRCLLIRPELAHELPESWEVEGAGAEAVMAVVAYLGEHEFRPSTAAVIQRFQGTEHESALVAAEADILGWGESFDVVAEFHGVLEKLRKDARKQQLHEFHARIREAGLSGLSEQERALYLQLLQQG
ncbi:DNA primase [Ferriphaselus sp. R-1]|uniref:DNA primase n=1 Tax=Ferriphaselus sp. R-1 TaxID=1485544 RepID=UPI000558D092|nr:DNA primase [Ferriphaselus sp. R-1]